VRSLRLAVIGDVHLAFDERDVRALDGLGYDAILFVGDLAGYRHSGGLAVARTIARLRTPTYVIPGNHDGVHATQLAAEVMENDAAIAALERAPFHGTMEARLEALRAALGGAVLGGYSRHRIEAPGAAPIELVIGRPHSFGGPRLAFRPYLGRAFGVSDLDASAAKLRALLDACSGERIVILSHNGPLGLGAGRADIWGCDFRASEGDFGDPDLRAALDHARASGKRVLGVLAGHMHHALRGGGTRRWQQQVDDVLHVNAARVPRVFRHEGRVVSHHVRIEIESDAIRADEVLLPRGA